MIIFFIDFTYCFICAVLWGVDYIFSSISKYLTVFFFNSKYLQFEYFHATDKRTDELRQLPADSDTSFGDVRLLIRVYFFFQKSD